MSIWKSTAAALFMLCMGNTHALEIIHGNSDEYIQTMENLTQAEQLLAKSIALITEAHSNGYSLPNSNLKKVLELSAKSHQELLILLRPEQTRSRIYEFRPDEDFLIIRDKPHQYQKALEGK